MRALRVRDFIRHRGMTGYLTPAQLKRRPWHIATEEDGLRTECGIGGNGIFFNIAFGQHPPRDTWCKRCVRYVASRAAAAKAKGG